MSNANAIPDNYLRRSFVYRELLAAGANFGEVAGAAVALAYDGAVDEVEQARRLGLADLSPLPRTGFKGPGTVEWLERQGIDVPEHSNQATPQSDGGLAARLAPGEVLLLGDLDATGDADTRLQQAWQRAWQEADEPAAKPHGFPVPRQDSHAWLALTGAHGAALFARLCGVDLRPAVFANHAIAQTSVARLNVIIVRHDLGATLNYSILPDSASAAYLWTSLTDAMAEFDGAPVGLTALRSLRGAGVE